MENAKEEFVEHVGERKVKCAIMSMVDADGDYTCKAIGILKVNHTEHNLRMFLIGINKEYDRGYGGQELYGTIWYEDGTWSSRREYDGSEWWEHHICPPIAEQLK